MRRRCDGLWGSDLINLASSNLHDAFWLQGLEDSVPKRDMACALTKHGDVQVGRRQMPEACPGSRRSLDRARWADPSHDTLRKTRR